MEQPDNSREQTQDQRSARKQQNQRGQQPPDDPSGGPGGQRRPEDERRQPRSGEDTGRDALLEGDGTTQPGQTDPTQERDVGRQPSSQNQRQR